MIKEEHIKPIPKHILNKIKKLDKKAYPNPDGHTRFYSYLTKYNNELAKVTVAVKNRYKQWLCKQVVVHGVHTDKCYLKDIIFYHISGYIVGWFAEGLTKEPKWYESNEWGYNEDKYFRIHCPIINKEYALTFPQYKYSAIDYYPYSDIIKYLRLYEKYPEMEMLVKFGLYNIATSISILKLVRKDKQFRKWLIDNALKVYHSCYYVSTIINAYKKKQDIEKTQQFEIFAKSFAKSGNYQRIKRLFNGNIEQFFNYLQKQNAYSDYYIDYLNACEYLGLDMSLDRNKMPHELRKWHDIRIDEYHSAKAKADAKERQRFFKRFEKIANKYMPMQRNLKDMYCVVIAKSPEDLVNEGNALHHCVGKMGYDQKFVNEETLIFFVRNKDNPQKPLVTLEYSLKRQKVLQCYAEHNTRPKQDILDFVNQVWLPYANKKLKKLVA